MSAITKNPKVNKSVTQTRPPIVTVMGHVDHGKTTLLDYLKKTNVAEKEAGGITQHIGAYQVESNGKLITFIDTPGHEAFIKIRKRGAQVTDIIILMVAADEEIKPQAKEVVNLAKETATPLIVAINKIDKEGARPEKITKDLAQEGIIPEEWGGENIFCSISAQTGEGVDNLLEMILLLAEMLELKIDDKAETQGTIIESHLDSREGVVATTIVQKGKLQVNSWVVAGTGYGKIKKMKNYKGEELKQALPGLPVLFTGLKKLPMPGDKLDICENEKLAIEQTKVHGEELEKMQIETDYRDKLIRIIIKADTQGSLEGIDYILNSIPKKDEEVCILKQGVGKINESDVKMAQIGDGFIVGFGVELENNINELARSRQVEIKLYDIIYRLKEDIEKTLESKREPKVIKVDLGKLKILKIFKRDKEGIVLGGKVISGKIKKNALSEIFKNKESSGKGKITSLQYLKQDVAEVKEGNECGIYFRPIDLNSTIEENDILEAYEEKIG